MTKKEFKPELIEYVGPSSSGKTYRTKKHIKKLKKKGVKVHSGYIYQENSLLFYFHIIQLPFCILKNVSYFKYIWSLFKKKTKTITKLKHSIRLSFIYFKLNKLSKYNVKYIILDHALIHEISALNRKNLIDIKKLNKHKVLNKLDSNYTIKFLEEKPEIIAKRRLKRQAKRDKKITEKEMIQKAKESNNRLTIIKKSL